MRYILASGSPRRKEILSKLGLEFDIIKAEGEEITDKVIPAEIVESLSKQKLLEVVDRVGRDESYIVISADTIVAVDDKVLGKPVDEKHAFDMIRLLADRNHQVYTGVSIAKVICGRIDEIRIFHERTDVFVKPMTDDDIMEYINCNESMDKAGAYAIQGEFAKYIDHIEGDYQNVVGLPGERVMEVLNSMNE